MNEDGLTDYQRGMVDALTEAATRVGQAIRTRGGEAVASWLMYQASAIHIQARIAKDAEDARNTKDE